jgi:hypothetical protein
MDLTWKFLDVRAERIHGSPFAYVLACLALGVAVLSWLASIAVAQAPVRVAVEGSLAAPAPADIKLGDDWVRLQFDDKGREPLEMQTAIIRYRPAAAKNGPANRNGQKTDATVDLVAAVHVGDDAYYRELNRRFLGYDAVLYELIAEPGTVVERGRGTPNSHPVGALQNGMKTMLALEHQLEKIDYTQKNFVHADLSPNEFMKAMQARNEGFLQMYMRLLGHSLAMQSDKGAKGESPEVELLAAFFSSDRPRKLKQALAKQLADAESMLVSFGGEDGSVLITDRNQAALTVLKQQLAAGKKQLAIFYGAGHLPDMDRHLREDFGLEPVEVTWLTAWDMRPRP